MNQSKFIQKVNWVSFFVDYFNKEIPNKNLSQDHLNFFSYVKMPVVQDTILVCYSTDVLKNILGLDQVDDQEVKNFISGKINPFENKNYSMVYSGHQFGVWAGQLGDGRVINIGEIKSQNQLWTIQVKGAGLTPYSRFADGNAVLRSTIREHFASEALYHLGIPTTRSLGVVKRNFKVQRDVLYNGMIQEESGSLNCRLAQGFIRIGNFQHLMSKQDLEGLEFLLNYTIENYFKNLANCFDKFFLFFEEVVKISAELVSKWQSFGFVHGVLNTDNHSVCGLTIDYGPFGFQEKFDQQYTANQIGDFELRYCYQNQPQIVLWNLYQLANSLMPLLKDKERVKSILDNFYNIYNSCIKEEFTKKLGFQYLNQQDFDELYKATLNLLQNQQCDFTLFFSELGRSIKIDSYQQQGIFKQDFHDKVSYKEKIDQDQFKNFEILYLQYLEKYQIEELERQQIMNNQNPVYILRNWFLQEIINQVENDNLKMLKEVEQMIQNPYKLNDQYKYYYQKMPKKYKNKPKFEILSCSSQIIAALNIIKFILVI